MLTTEQRKQFSERGYIYLKNAFSRADAETMQAVVWNTLAEKYGIDQLDPTTWSHTTIYKLQDLKPRAEFQAIGSDIVLGVINELLGENSWKKPRDWGQFLVTFPETDTWTVPADWHLDFDFLPYIEPLSGILMFSFFGDVDPQGGGTAVVSGSHHLAAHFTASHPDLQQAKMKKWRTAFMKSDPWLVALSTDGDEASRIPQFMDADHRINDIPLRVRELTGQAGDVVIAHPLLLHTRAFNARKQPRFMLVQRLSRNK